MTSESPQNPLDFILSLVSLFIQNGPRTLLELLDRFDPGASLLLFFLSTFLMIWRLGSLEGRGIQGTVLGTLIMPYCSGLSNLIFAYVLGRAGGNGTLVLENCLVNNVTNLTLLLGLPAVFWTMDIKLRKGGGEASPREQEIRRLNHLSLLLTLLAVLFFTGVLWALALDNRLDQGDGMVLVGLFLFWQVFHVFDVLKQNVQRQTALSWMMTLDLLLILSGGYGVYASVERLFDWTMQAGAAFVPYEMLGWLSGFLMVLPNALLALYYGWSGRPDVVYSSQAGDGHICIPMCIGLFALFQDIQIPAFFELGVRLLLIGGTVHFFFIAVLGRLPRLMGGFLTGAYLFFLYQGLLAP